MRIHILCLCIIVCAATTIAATITVPVDQPTIQAGINAASTGDTIIVLGGEYVENINFLGKSIKVMASEGPSATRLIPAVSTEPLVRITAGEDSTTEFSGFEVTGSFGRSVIVVDSNAYPRISGNVFHDCKTASPGPSYVVDAKSRAYISRNLFYNNTLSWNIFIQANYVTIINNTFFAVGSAIRIDKDYCVIRNNIIVYGGSGIRKYCLGQIDIDYNNVWHNGRHYDYEDVPGNNYTLGLHNISVDPQFQDSLVGYGLLNFYSPCRDAGDPDPAFNDPDGSRDDMGAYPVNTIAGQWPLPFNINFGPDAANNIANHTPTFYWSYHDSNDLQTAVKIDVGTDTDWTVAEMWSLTASQSDTSATYAGGELVDGQTYYYRIQVAGPSGFGDWRYGSFFMNRKPPAVWKFWPPKEYVLRSDRVVLKATGYADPDKDSLFIVFEMCFDSAFQIPLIRDSIPCAPVLTLLRLPELPSGVRLWWRAAAYDGYEQSGWQCHSEGMGWSFSTRPGPGPMHVPSEFPTLKMAVDAAYDGDTVYIEPGQYTESLDRIESSVTMISTGGADSTVLKDGGAAFARASHLADLTFDHFRIGLGDSSTVSGCVLRNGVFQPSYFSLFPQGGGAVALNGNSRFSRCRFENNAVVTGVDWQDHYQTPLYSYGGGGCVLTTGGSSIFDTCQFIGNSAHWGGVLAGYNCTPTFRYCLFAGNSASDYGGAVTGSAIFENCTFFGNSSPDGSVVDFLGGAAKSRFVNCLVVGNRQGTVFSSGGSESIQFCDIYGNEAGDWIGYLAEQLGINGNISADPLFCDTAQGKFTIHSDSPCRLAGSDGRYIGAFGIGCGDIPDDPDDPNDPNDPNDPEDPENPDDSTGQGGDDTPPIAYIYELLQNSPNPFNNGTKIIFSLARPSDVSITVYNLLGERVTTLMNGFKDAGIYDVIWDGTDYSGHQVATGIYFYRIMTCDYSATRKMLMLK